MSEPRKFKWVGTRPIRPDGVDKVTGRARFGADQHPAGALHGKVLRSPHAHARIRGIDTSAALEMPGVHAVLVGSDLPMPSPGTGTAGEGPTDFVALAHNVLARDKVLYHGHPVAVVAATDPHLAEEALGRIVVDYQPLPAVFDVLEAMEPDAPILDDERFTKGVDPAPEQPGNVASRFALERGDAAAALAAADVVVQGEFRCEAVHQGYIEPHAAVAEVSEDGQATVWCCTQGPFMVRAYCAQLLDLPISKIKVVPSEIGGGFGGKTTVYVEPLAIALARKTGRPVKIVMSREEVFRATGPGSAGVVRLELGATRDGKLTGARAWLAYEAGAYPGSPVNAGVMTVTAAYAIDDFLLEGFDVVVNKPKACAYRAPGAPIATFATESLMDELARKLEVDPIDLRLRNAAKSGVHASYGPRYRDIGMVETLEAARAHPHWKAPLGENEGRGLATGMWFNAGMQSSAAVSLNEDGTATVVAGTPDIGGSRASLALMCAEELDLDVARIRPIVTDTETVGYNDSTGGSRVTFATGMAVIEASRELVAQLRERAAKTWDVPVEDVEWKEGAAHLREGAGEAREPLELATITGQASRTGGPLTARHSLVARGIGPGFATHLVDVRVDPETGKVDVVRYTAIQDAGKAVHPSYVEGQMQGGAAQGIGWALNEEYVYDGNGVLQNAGFLDYRIPVALDLPMIDTVIIEVPNPKHPHGVRGVGEVPLVPPLAAVANAVRDASGARIQHTPLSPPRVLQALDELGS